MQPIDEVNTSQLSIPQQQQQQQQQISSPLPTQLPSDRSNNLTKSSTMTKSSQSIGFDLSVKSILGSLVVPSTPLKKKLLSIVVTPTVVIMFCDNSKSIEFILCDRMEVFFCEKKNPRLLLFIFLNLVLAKGKFLNPWL